MDSWREGVLTCPTRSDHPQQHECHREVHELATFRIWKLETVPIRWRSCLLESQYPEREALEPVRREPDSRRTLRRLRRSTRSTPPGKVRHLQQCSGTHP